MLKLLGRNAVIIVPKKDLIDQWEERILATTDLKKEDIGKGLSGKIDWQGKKIVISLVHTATKYMENYEFRNAFGVALFDECDSSCPPETFAPVASMFQAKYRLSMTASPTRADGLHVVFDNHLVEVEVNCNKSNTMTPEILFVNYRNDSGEFAPFSKQGGNERNAVVLPAKNMERHVLIADYINKAAILDGHPTCCVKRQDLPTKNYTKDS